MPRPNRRSFLKTITAGAIVSATGLEERAAAEAPTAPARPSSPLSHVNILQGTNSTHSFSRGNTLPITALPFGMAHWTLQSNIVGGSWFFQPADRRIEGIRCTHQLSPWLSDYGHATFLPVDAAASPNAAARASSYRPEESTLSPAEMKLDLLRYNTTLELAPTTRGAILRITSLASAKPGLAIDLPGTAAEITLENGLVRCRTNAHAGGVPTNFATYYVLKLTGHDTSVAPQLSPVTTNRNQHTAILHYTGTSVEVRIASSFISFEQAERNLATELTPFSYDQIKAQATAVWDDHLGRAIVEGGTLDERRTFYSCTYRALLFPRTFHELDAAGKPIHYSAFNGKVEPGVMYADHGYWDVYRVWYPWMSVMFPDRLGEILQAWVNASKEGGWLPQFPAPGYRACMTGSLIDAVFADAVVKDIPGFDAATAYAALRKHATQPGNADKGYGRRGIEDYLKLGFVAEDHIHQSAAETVDSAYGDFCIAQVAAHTGHTEDAAMFTKRSENWKHLFDPKTKYLRGKTADGVWFEPFDPIRWGSPYVEGAAWQHRWDVPHDLRGLFDAMGGDAAVVAELEKMLTMAPDFQVGSYGQEIHEMSEMAARHFGQYAHSNQPVHHVLYLFALAGRPDRTRYWTSRVMRELYTPDDFAGDEDTGSMAAWYLMSACGFGPVCPGKPEYVFGAPLFPKVTLKLAKTTLTITSGTQPKGQITVDGKATGSPIIQHKDLVKARTLHFS